MDPTIYPQLKAIARPILRDYQTDLTVHDRAACRALRPGDIVFWCARTMGTHMAFMEVANQPPAEAFDQADFCQTYLRAIEALHQPDWHMITCTARQRGTVRPISFDDAEQMAIRARARERFRLARIGRRDKPAIFDPGKGTRQAA